MRRRSVLLLATMTLAIIVASGVALAKNIQCPNRDNRLCVGTDNNDTMTGTTRDDNIRARGGNDAVMARGGSDVVLGQAGFDGPLSGGAGNDTLNAGTSPDNTAIEFISGGPGNDTLVESQGIDRYIFEPGWGEDQITGNGDQAGAQPDSDNLCFSCGTTLVTANLTINLATGTATDGTSTVTWDATVPFIEGATGGFGADHITGSSIPNNIVNGSDGADTIDVSGDGDGDVINCGGSDGDADTVTRDAGDFIVPNSCGPEDSITNAS